MSQDTPKVEAIIERVEPEIRLGSISVADAADGLQQAAKIATLLADIINKKELFSIIRNKKTGEKRKYVKCEGWTTMGMMLGVVPVEKYCRRLEDNKGFEAKVNIIRTRDGGLVGSASAECTYDESNWRGRDSYSLRSMALTRATSKAFRLSFSWIIKLAGFEVTPAEEMMADEDASVTRAAVEAEVERQKGGNSNQPMSGVMQPSVFISWPPEQEKKFAFVTGLTAIKNLNLKPYIEREAKGIWSAPDSGWIVPASRVAELKQTLNELKCPFVEKT